MCKRPDTSVDSAAKQYCGFVVRVPVRLHIFVTEQITVTEYTPDVNSKCYVNLLNSRTNFNITGIAQSRKPRNNIARVPGSNPDQGAHFSNAVA
jgi:hypothetical protein